MKIADLPLNQLQALVESLDEDGNGVIDLEEFEIALGSVDTMHFDDDEYLDELEERWGQDIAEDDDVKSAPRPPPDRRETAAPRPPPDQRKSEDSEPEPEENNEKRPRRVIRRKSNKSDSNNRRRVTRVSKKTNAPEESDKDDEDHYDEALRRLTGSGFDDDS